jgi:integrase
MASPADIKQLRERIESSDQVSDADRENLLQFSRELGRYRSEWGHERHLSVVKRLIMLSWGGTKYDGEDFHDSSLTEALEDREAAGEIVEWINTTYSNEETNRDMRNALRLLGKVLTNDDPTDKDASPPPCIDWVPATTPDNYDPLPNPADMIAWEEVRQMCEHPETNARDAALLALAWDAGPRSGELEQLTLGDISDHDLGKIVHVDGKTGERDVRITNAVPYVRQWLNQHPGTDSGGMPEAPDIPLWSKLKKPEGISYRLYRDVFKKGVRRIGLDKPDDPTNFRKSSASALASKGISQSHLEKRYGWKRGSDAASRYIRVFGEDADRELANARGMDVDLGEDEPEGPKDCKRCGVLIDQATEKCDNCGFIQDRKLAEEEVSPVSGGVNLRKLVGEEIDKQIDKRTAQVAAQVSLGMIDRLFGGSGEIDPEEWSDFPAIDIDVEDIELPEADEFDLDEAIKKSA